MAKMTPERRKYLERAFYPVLADVTQVQFYDCTTCRAIVIDRDAHDRWHERLIEEA